MIWKHLWPLQWRHTECDGVSNRRRRDWLLIRLFRRRSKKTLKLRCFDHYGAIILASRRIKSPATQLLVQQRVHASNKYIVKVLSLARHDVTLCCAFEISGVTQPRQPFRLNGIPVVTDSNKVTKPANLITIFQILCHFSVGNLHCFTPCYIMIFRYIYSETSRFYTN